MQIIADLQLHSKYARAVSKNMTIPAIAGWAKRKGIGLVATGDWTHPLWMREIEANLEETGNGLLTLKRQTLDDRSEKLDLEVRNLKLDRANLISSFQSQGLTSNVQRPTSPLFLLATEVSCIYSQGGKLRRIHTLIWVPSLSSAQNISKEMTKRGCNLMSDGRPIIGLTSIQVAELVLSIEPKALLIPAHAWTPWFSLYGSMSGFDSIDEAFGPYAKHIFAVETGLSSSPSMNWRIKELDHRSIVSFSDAHSGPKLGREATVFEMPDGQLSYDAIYQAIRGSQMIDVGGKKVDLEVRSWKLGKTHLPSNVQSQNPNSSFYRPTSKSSIAYTIEFYPEEGKYHYAGHRTCGIRFSPEETKQKGTTCPTCGKPLTIGVMQRVEDLASRSEADLQISNIKYQISNMNEKIQMVASKAFPHRPPFAMLVPLQEIIAEAVGSPVASPKVQTPYFRLTEELGGEFAILLHSSLARIADVAGERIAQGIDKVRTGDIVIDPGYDGVFGVVKIWKEGETKPLLDATREQLTMF